MAKEKNKPVAVRFDLKMLELLKEEEKIETPKHALNFLTNFWENNRPAKTGFEKEFKDTSFATPKPADIKKKETAPTAHPSGLSGLDLSIWKAEQKEKNKNAGRDTDK